MKLVVTQPFARLPRIAAPACLLASGLIFVTAAYAQPGGNRQRNNNQGQQQQRASNSQMREQLVRRQLTMAGYTNAKLQETIVAYVKAKEEGRQPLYDAANQAAQGLAKQDTTDAAAAALCDNFNAALEEERNRILAAEKELDNTINYSQDKRLAAVLTLMGVIGDAMAYLVTPDSGSRGGPGGGQGEPGGNMGGPGGGDMGGPGGPPPGNWDGGPMQQNAPAPLELKPWQRLA